MLSRIRISWLPGAGDSIVREVCAGETSEEGVQIAARAGSRAPVPLAVPNDTSRAMPSCCDAIYYPFFGWLRV